ncbi:NAD-dependent epimerase/dehydratase family protein [bacterium]|nr:NAD-dependent epimerase/dehydratase family protein [bacterium]
MAKIVVTGAAGFIGYHLSKSLAKDGHTVIGFDNFNDFYYDSQLKYHRKELLDQTLGVIVKGIDLNNYGMMDDLFKEHQPDTVIHLAAHAGVRHSLEYPREYINNNINGTQNLIELCEKAKINDVIYASTSCTMAGNPLPWNEGAPTGHQLNPYGYTKYTNECQFMTSGIPKTTGLRFFTVYGPWGRPDMALFKFTEGIVRGTPIEVFNYGDMKRDFTYVDDIVEGIKTVTKNSWDSNEFKNDIYNIGRGEQVQLMDFITEIEKNFDKEAEKVMLPKHPADTQETWSDTTKLQSLGWKPKTSIPEGVAKFAEWYKEYYNV